MTTRSRTPALVYFVLVLLSLAIFLADLVFPLGVAAGVPFVAVVLLAFWTRHRQTVLITAGAVSVLTVVGFFFPLPEEGGLHFLEQPIAWVGMENRLIALFAIWATAALAVVLLRSYELIHRERDFNKSLVETASSIILLLDRDGRILHFNRFTTEASGYELAEIKGKDWLEIFVPESDRAQARKLFEDCMAGLAGQDRVLPILTRQGELRQFSWATRVMHDEAGGLRVCSKRGLTAGPFPCHDQPMRDESVHPQPLSGGGGYCGGIGSSVSYWVPHRARFWL